MFTITHKPLETLIPYHKLELTMANGFMFSLERNNSGPRPKIYTGDPDSKPSFSIPTLVLDPVTRIEIRSGMQDPDPGLF